ncbi:MAG: V-type ATP synthase subunit I [Candidatus Poseidoniales archaeon]|nr:MAG: V-type ATP synthase subunit I [Candidatus Poseidoniales archaeon]
MFDTVAMSRLTVAAPLSNMEDVLRACTNEGCVHVETYANFEDGIQVGQAINSDEANEVSALLAKVRAAVSAFKPVNADGPLPVRKIKDLISGDFPAQLQDSLNHLDQQRDAEAEVALLVEQIKLMKRLVPLGVDLELLMGSDRVEVFVAETSKASKAASTFGELASRVELASAPGVVAVACMPSDSAEVQMALGELGGKPVQIPNMEGSPKKILGALIMQKESAQATQESSKKQANKWADANARHLLAVQEHLSKEDEIFTAPTQMAVSGQAFALDAWVPTAKEQSIRASLKHIASHVEVEAFVNDHHGHDDHDDHGEEVAPPIALENGEVSKPFELLVGLVGRPAYGTFDPTFFMMLTFPIIYGLILGDFGYGLIVLLIGMYLGTKPFAADPVVNNGITILKWMGVWCIIWGLLFAEGFGFVWDESWSPLAPFYEWTKSMTDGNLPEFVTGTLGMSHTYIPFHRATGALTDYVLLSVYLGIVHLAFGFILGFINVARGHGLAAAFFEKGSWMLILFGGTLHIYGFLTDPDIIATTPTIWAMVTLVGVACLIVGLAVYEKFGWAGGIIMGPIETFGLLANTLSYLRVMGVGVAGVKIAEVSITMGFDLMVTTSNPLLMVVGLLLFVLIQAFALALGILSPSIHAARLHFVEWMGKFYDGTGRIFSPLGGRTLHTEGQS